MKPKIISFTVLIAAVVLFIVLFLNPFTVIPPGYVGVKVLFGKVQPGVLHEGFHIINPLYTIVKMDTRLQAYTMSATPTEGERRGDDAIEALTSEGLKVKLDITAWFRLIPEKAPEVYRKIGLDYVSKVVRPLLRTAIRDIAVKFSAEDIYSNKREEFVEKIQQRAIELAQGKGIEIDRILLRNVKLPKEVEDAINAKITANQEAQKMEFILEKERKEKERKIIEAEGIREANRIIAQSLTPNYLRWYRIEILKSLVNSPNNTIIVIPEDLKALPMVMPGGK